MIDAILRGYIACALWSSTDDWGDPLDQNCIVLRGGRRTNLPVTREDTTP